MEGKTADKVRLRFVIIGAGMSGVLTAIKLQERGDTNFVVYEKGDTVGGTWRENHYPGLACDTPAHSYTYSFAFNPDWSAYYAPGPEIHDYFKRVARQYGLHSRIEFNSEVVACDWIEGQWHVRLRDGRVDIADVVVAATGVLHHPSYPDIPGLDDFAGHCFHSARWDDSVPLSGKRIGVIGSGSTGVQIVSALSPTAAKLVHFVRSPQWIMPCPDTRYSADDRAAFRADPALIEKVRNGPDAAARRDRFLKATTDAASAAQTEIQAIVEKNLEDSVRDPALKEKLRPNYRAACKRMIFSHDYYEAIQRPNSFLETADIAHIEPEGVRMTDGSFHELDVIALATGFRVNMFVRPISIHGEGGIDLDAFWQPNPRAYYAVTVPGFPNFFMLNGPTAPVGNFTLIDISEAQWTYADQLIDLIRSGHCRAVAPRMEALESYEQARNEQAMKTVYASGCKSWYLDAKGVPQVWPWDFGHFREVMAKPRLEDYQFT